MNGVLTILLLVLATVVYVQWGSQIRAKFKIAAKKVAPAKPLSPRLHKFAQTLEAFINSAAHPGELSEQPAFKDGVALLSDPAVPQETVLQYALGANLVLACMGFAALAERDDRDEAVDQALANFEHLAPWAAHFALELFCRAENRPDAGAPVAMAKEWWADNYLLPMIFTQYFERRKSLGDHPEFGQSLATALASAPAVRAFLNKVHHPFSSALLAQLGDEKQTTSDRGFLAGIGRYWHEEVSTDRWTEAASWQHDLDVIEAAIVQDQARSLLVIGDPAVGKTSFLKLLAARLAGQGWTVFEASGADLMAGQMWFGQLEERVRRAVEELAVGKKQIWYVPDLLAFARSGTHHGQSASLLDQILPALAARKLIIWTEATPSAATKLLQMRPGLRHVLDRVQLDAMSEGETSDIARAVSRELEIGHGVTIGSDVVPAALEAARQYLSAASLPGSALTLLKLTLARAETAGTKTVNAQHVFDALAQFTGLPISILDNRDRIDLASIRAHFAARVMGQDEAIDSIVERIAMLKAGLNDPDKPIGVFLFAGPTGTGKTELAKTTAEYLFGSADRMIRLDMSEFQTAESVSVILGDGGAAGDGNSLIARVRKQPFSLVLLDEFEKAHPRIWDLFLQVFDDGRLSDVYGQVADFRHCIIILTSNLGVTTQTGSGMGFAPAAYDGFSSEPILRAIRETYKPEFQNRIDRIIVFRPLTRDLMRDILKKELADVLDRRGLRDRAWAVEWESSALEFLLEKGFSPEMGARPLKRAIDQYLLAPLAATIVEWRFPEGEQFLFIRSDGRSIQAEFVDPDRSDVPEPEAAINGSTSAEPITLPAMILAPSGTRAESSALQEKLAEIDQVLSAPEWDEGKVRLAGLMSESGFWSNPRRFETLARIAMMDRVAAAAETARALATRLMRGAESARGVSRELVSRLALQLHVVEHGLRDIKEEAPVEVALLVEPALDSDVGAAVAAREWSRDIMAMYRAWAGRRNMQSEDVAIGGRDGAMVLLVSGFGAHRVLRQEVGLHVLEQPDGSGRIAARVCLLPSPLGDQPPAKLNAHLATAFAQAPRSATVVRRYRREPSPLVRNASGSWRSGKLDAVMSGDFDLLEADPQ